MNILEQTLRSKNRWLWFATAALAVILVLVQACINVNRAGAQVTPPQPLPVTDYANYPANNGLPPGCDANAIIGASFSVNGGPEVSNLQDLGVLNAGDTVAMSWTDVLPVCEDGTNLIPIVLAMKSTQFDYFDPTDNQHLDLPYAMAFGEAGQPGSVSYVLPPLNDDSFPGCFGQLDAIAGLPLAVVGPDGSFYATGVPWDMLVSAWNGSYPECDALVPPTTIPETTTTVPEPTTTTTTTAPEATTTTTVPVALDVTPTEETVTVPEVEVAGVVAQDDSAVALARQPLPVTGAVDTGLWVAMGVLLIVAGGLTLAAARRKENA